MDEILKGSWDLHLYAGPDPRSETRQDALEVARGAYEAEMSGFVLKADSYTTAPLAQALTRMYPGLDVVGAVVLNHAVGGLNADAVRVTADLRGRAVWMPTADAASNRRDGAPGPGIPLLDDTGALLPQVGQVLDVVAGRNLLLVSGLASPEETVALFKEASTRGVERMLATDTGDTPGDALHELASLGAYVERAYRWLLPPCARRSLDDLLASIKSLGVQRCVVTTGLGGWADPAPAEGMRMAIAALLHAGMGADEVSMLVKGNPAGLLGGAGS